MNEQQLAVLIQQLRSLVSDFQTSLPTLHERAALAAMQGLLADCHNYTDNEFDVIAKAAWKAAEAFMTERTNRKDASREPNP